METRAACDVLEIPEYWRFDELGERTQARNHIMAAVYGAALSAAARMPRPRLKAEISPESQRRPSKGVAQVGGAAMK